MATIPVSPTPAPKESELEVILHDLFVVGVTAASIFVKNPKSQQKAATIIGVLQGLIPSLGGVQPAQSTTGILD